MPHPSTLRPSLSKERSLSGVCVSPVQPYIIFSCCCIIIVVSLHPVRRTRHLLPCISILLFTCVVDRMHFYGILGLLIWSSVNLVSQYQPVAAHRVMIEGFRLMERQRRAKNFWSVNLTVFLAKYITPRAEERRPSTIRDSHQNRHPPQLGRASVLESLLPRPALSR